MHIYIGYYTLWAQRDEVDRSNPKTVQVVTVTMAIGKIRCRRYD